MGDQKQDSESAAKFNADVVSKIANIEDDMVKFIKNNAMKTTRDGIYTDHQAIFRRALLDTEVVSTDEVSTEAISRIRARLNK